MKILILESNIHVASALEKAFDSFERDIAIAPKDYSSKPIKVFEDYIKWLKPVVIYRGSINSVYAGERNKDICDITNTTNALRILEACKEANCPFVYISSANVFDGKKGAEYIETDIPHPINNVGRAKLKTKNEVKKYEKGYIVRPGWIYGFPGDMIVKTCKIATDNKEYNQANPDKKPRKILVNWNIRANSIYLKDLAYNIYCMILSEKPGIYHFFNEGEVTKSKLYKYALETFKLLDDTLFEEYDTDASTDRLVNPSDIRLSSKYIEDPLYLNRSWQNAMDEYFFELLQQDYIKKLKKKPQ